MNDGFCFFALLLASVLCCTSGFKITGKDDVLKLAAEASNLVNIDEIVLTTDLDLKGERSFPLGVDTSGACTPFRGVLDGQGHRIKNLVMDWRNNNAFSGAGLFCQMEGATVKNLVIDGSCSFSGDFVGVVSSNSRGKLDLVNVTNYAQVSGVNLIGGLIGNISYVENTAVTIENCSNFGPISGTGAFVGGLIASFENSHNCNLSIRNSRNHGIISLERDGSVHAGGFLGWVQFTQFNNISFTDCENNADFVLTSNGARAGGFLGWMGENKNSSLSLTRCTNNGNLESHTRSDWDYTAGFIGTLDVNTKLDVVLTDVLNTGNVTADSQSGSHNGGVIGTANRLHDAVFVLTNVTNTGNITVNSVEETSSASGLIGRMEDTKEYAISLSLSNCANIGTVTHKTDRACGLFYVGSNEMHTTETYLNDCVNKGSVHGGIQGYGIANAICEAKNVVSMGHANNAQFWYTGTGEGLFGLKFDDVIYPDGTRTFVRDDETGFYKTIEEGEWVDPLLNDRLTTENSTTRWTSSLDISKRITLHVSSPLNETVDTATGNTLQRAAELHNLALDGFVLVDSDTHRLLYGTTVLDADTSVLLSHWLTVCGNVSQRTIVPHGTRLGDIPVLGAFFGDHTVGVFNTTSSSTKTLCNASTVVTEDLEVTVLPLSQIEITLEPDDGSRIDDDELSRVLEVVVRESGGAVGRIDVVEDGDGVLVVRITLTEDSTDSVRSVLEECSSTHR